MGWLPKISMGLKLDLARRLRCDGATGVMQSCAALREPTDCGIATKVVMITSFLTYQQAWAGACSLR
jgi:hypothetical protein